MGDMWRSQKMTLVQMIVQNDAAHAVVNKLGTVGIVEFRDLNAGTSFHRRSFVEEVRKCDELARVLRTIAEEYENSEIVISDKDDRLSLSLSLDDVEPKINEVHEELTGLKSMQDQLLKNHNALQEQRLVLELGKKIYGARQQTSGMVPLPAETKSYAAELMALSEFAQSSSSLLGQVSGVINKELAQQLERVLFRATRGNAVFETEPIEQKLLDVDAKGAPEPVEKVFFMVLFAGEVMREKISKICAYFGATLYNFPESADELTAMVAEVERRIIESDEVLGKGEAVLHELLASFANTYATWNFVVQKEKVCGQSRAKQEQHSSTHAPLSHPPCLAPSLR